MQNDIFSFNFAYNQSLWCLEDIKEIFTSICEILREELNSNNAKIEAILDLNALDQVEQLIKTAQQEMGRYEYDIISNTEFTDYSLTGIQRLSYRIRNRKAVMYIMKMTTA